MSGLGNELPELHRLQVDYGRDWRIWRSAPTPEDRSGWYATRRRYSDRNTGRGLWPTLGADTAEELRRQLDDQTLAANAPEPSTTVNPIDSNLN